MLRNLLALLVGVAIGLGGGYAIWQAGVFSSDEPTRHDIEQAVIESDYGDPLGATCGRRQGTDHVWQCTARFDGGCTHDYRITATSAEITVSPINRPGDPKC